MSKQFGSDPELTPEAIEVLNGITEETRPLREIDFEETPPAPVFEAD